MIITTRRWQYSIMRSQCVAGSHKPKYNFELLIPGILLNGAGQSAGLRVRKAPCQRFQ